jgi:hypothetical protein
MVAGTILITCLTAAQAPAAPEKEPAVTPQKKRTVGAKKRQPPRKPATRPRRSAKRDEAAQARWRQLSQERRERLRRAYTHLKESLSKKEWERCRELHQGSEAPRLERLPSHWRAFLVRYARWARKELEKLPAEQRQRIEQLPPEKRSEAIKEALRPLFRRHLYQCRKAAREVFTPLELKLLRQLPPKERAKVLRESGQSAFGLISPWSWRKYQDSGPRKALVWEYLNAPEALTGAAARKPPAPRRRAALTQRSPDRTERRRTAQEPKRPSAKQSSH